MVDLDNPYALSADKSEEISQQILETYARGKASLRFPRLAVLGGQPGAGKTTILRIISKGFDPDKQPVIVTIDDLRDFHLVAHEIFTHHPFDFAIYTNKEAWIWTDRLLTTARRARNNTVYETTLRRTTPVEMITRAFQAEGYAVDLHALAINSKLSLQGIYARYETQYRFKPAPRWTPIEFHDASYASFPESVAYMEANAGLEKVAVYRRDGAVLYHNDDKNAPALGAKQAIVNERNKAWTPDEKTKLVQSWNDILALIDERTDVKPYWYTENAKRLHREAELFAAARQAQASERPILSAIEEITHHHVFTRKNADAELVCFDISVFDAARLPSSSRSMRLVPQGQDAKPK